MANRGAEVKVQASDYKAFIASASVPHPARCNMPREGKCMRGVGPLLADSDPSDTKENSGGHQVWSVCQSILVCCKSYELSLSQRGHET